MKVLSGSKDWFAKSVTMMCRLTQKKQLVTVTVRQCCHCRPLLSVSTQRSARPPSVPTLSTGAQTQTGRLLLIRATRLSVSAKFYSSASPTPHSTRAVVPTLTRATPASMQASSLSTKAPACSTKATTPFSTEATSPFSTKATTIFSTKHTLLSTKATPSSVQLPSRPLSTQATPPSDASDERGHHPPHRTVLLSQSRDIFENLALEEWLYDNLDLTHRDYLLVWRNTPAVVIGRHQNPWAECDVERAWREGVPVVRRISGGGAVYHDEGNLNLSFLTHRKRYDRKRNLQLVVSALTSEWPSLDLDINCRDDIILDGLYKVSGTAAKLGGKRSFHHFTLVFDVDKLMLSSLLASPLAGVDSKATASVRSRVMNLSEVIPDMTFDSLVQVIGHRFLQGEDSKMETVDPADEGRYPGTSKIQQRLKSWDWTFVRTPPFVIQRTFVKTFPSYRLFSNKRQGETLVLTVKMKVEKGRLQSVSLSLALKASNDAVTRQHKAGTENSKSIVTDTDTDTDTDRVAQVPFRLLDILREGGGGGGEGSVEGTPLQGRRLREAGKGWVRKVVEEEGAEDYEVLRWGLQCMMGCLPVPAVATTGEGEGEGWWLREECEGGKALVTE